MTIKLITFDLDNTLWDVEPIVVRAEKLMQLFLLEKYPPFLSFLHDHFWQELRAQIETEAPHLAYHLTYIRKKIIQRALQVAQCPLGLQESLIEEAFAVYYQARNQVEFFPDVLPVLEQLAQNYPLYALSNGNADIKQVGLGHVFSAHFSAISEGQPKPHPKMYLSALAAAGVAPHEALHIGDHPEQDILAANAIGMQTIWMNWQKQKWTHANDVLQAYSMQDILKVVERR